MKLTQEVIDKIQEAMLHTKMNGDMNWLDGDEIDVCLGGTFSGDKFISIINNYNVIIKRIALKYDISILDLYSKFKEQINENDSVPYTTSELRRLRGLRAVILYYVFGWSWNRIGKKYKLQLLCDHIHLNERGGSLMENMVEKFLSA